MFMIWQKEKEGFQPPVGASDWLGTVSDAIARVSIMKS